MDIENCNEIDLSFYIDENNQPPTHCRRTNRFSSSMSTIKSELKNVIEDVFNNISTPSHNDLREREQIYINETRRPQPPQPPPIPIPCDTQTLTLPNMNNVLNDCGPMKISKTKRTINFNSSKIKKNIHDIDNNLTNIKGNSYNIDTNIENITQNFKNIETNIHNISDNTAKAKSNLHDINENTNNIKENTSKIIQNYEQHTYDIQENYHHIEISSSKINGLNIKMDDSAPIYKNFTKSIIGSGSGGNFEFVMKVDPTFKTMTMASDIRLKRNVHTIKDALYKINTMRGVEWNWKNNNIQTTGLIAQELQKIAPDLVNDTEEFLSVNYIGLFGYVIEAFKEQTEIQKQQTNKINSLERKLNIQTAELNALQTKMELLLSKL